MIKKTIFILFIGYFMIYPSGLYAQKKEKKATEEYSKQKLSDDERQKFDYFFYEAMNAKAIDDYSSAFDYLQHCEKIDSTNANVLYEIGSFYNSTQKKDLANKYWSKAVKYDPDNYYYSMSYAGSLLEKQDYAEAIKVYDKLIAKNPSKVELYMYLSEAYRMNGDFLKSISALNDLERTMGMNEQISIQKFKLYSALNDKSKAYAEVQKYIDENPKDIRYYVLLGNLYLQDGKNQQAYQWLSKAKALEPDNPMLITSFASYHEKMGDQDAANKELKLGLFSPKLDIDTKMAILGQYISSLDQEKKDTKQVNPILDSLMVEYPQEPKFNFMYGNLLLLQNNKSDANHQYRLFAEANPTNPVGWENVLQTTDMDSINTLIEVCTTAITNLPEEALFYFYLSIGEFQKKEYDKSIATLQKGIQYVDPENVRLLSEFYGQIGNIYHELGQVDSSFVNFDLSLKYNPQNLLILNNYSYYLSLLRQDLDKAENMSSITVKAEPTNPTYLDTYGWILFEQGAYPMAKIYLKSAVQYSEEKEKEVSAVVLEHYGDVLYMTNEKEEALEYWKKAKEKGSESTTIDKKIETKTYIPEETKQEKDEAKK